MKFRNPWIDPRVVQVRPEQVQAYLLGQGWKPLGPAENHLFVLFAPPGEGEDRSPVLLPLQLDQGAMLQRMIEVVEDVARAENRWAVDVLNDMLRQPADLVPANGPAAPARSEPASR